MGLGDEIFTPSPAYLKTLAKIESGDNPNARNPKSSAKGRYQFIDGTAKQYGITAPFGTPEYEQQEADAIVRFTRDNHGYLNKKLGRSPNDAELYLAHQQGPGGAVKLLSDPTANAAATVGADAINLNAGAPTMTSSDFSNTWTDNWDSAFKQVNPTPAPPAGFVRSAPTAPAPTGNGPLEVTVPVPAAPSVSAVPPPPAGFTRAPAPPAGFEPAPIPDEELLGGLFNRDSRTGQIYVDGPDATAGDFDGPGAVLNGVRDAAVGLATIPADLAQEYNVPGYEGMGDMISRNIPELRSGKGVHADEFDSGLAEGGQDVLRAVTNYAAPARAMAGAAGKATELYPKAVQYLAKLTGAVGADMAVTDPNEAQTLGDIFSFGPTDIEPEDTPMAKRAKVGAETALVEPVVSVASGVGRLAGKAIDKVKDFSGYRSADDVEKATANALQSKVVDRDAAVENIDKTLAEVEGTGFKPMTGEASRDVGLIQIQKAQQPQTPLQARKVANEEDTAAQFQELTAPSGKGDPNALKTIAEDEQAATVGAAQGKLDNLKKDMEAADAELANDAANLATSKDGKVSGSEKLNAILTKTRDDMTAAKNELYAAVDPDGSFAKEADDFLAKVDEIQPEPGAVDSDIPAGIKAEIDKLRPQDGADEAIGITRMADDGSVEASSQVGEGAPQLSFRTLVNLRQSVSEAIGQARRDGKGAQVKNLVRMKQAIDGEIDSFKEIAGSDAAARLKDAQDYFAEQFAPRFRQGQGGKFDKAVKSGQPGAVTPSKTAGTFLDGTKEKAGDLSSILDAAESPEAGRAAVREHLIGEMASKVTDGQKVNVARLQQWIDKNAETLKKFPEVRAEIMKMRNQLGLKTKKVGDLQMQIEEASKGVKQSEKEFNANALSLYLKNDDPLDAVKKAMSGTNRRTKMRQLVSAAKKDTSGKALEGLKDTLKEAMREQLRTSGVTVGGTVKSSPAKFIDLAEDKELLGVLSDIFDETEMKSLRQIRAKLEILNRSDTVKGTDKSTTNELAQNADQLRIVLASFLGITQGKGYFQIGKWLQKTFGRDPLELANQMINEAMLDPELAKTLLMKDIDANDKAIKSRLRTYITNNVGALPANEESNKTPAKEK